MPVAHLETVRNWPDGRKLVLGKITEMGMICGSIKNQRGYGKPLQFLAICEKQHLTSINLVKYVIHIGRSREKSQGCSYFKCEVMKVKNYSKRQEGKKETYKCTSNE